MNAIKEKQVGQDQAAERKRSLLKFARRLAVECAMRRADRTVSADDVQAELVRQGVSDRALGSSAGSLFRGRDWQWTGEFVSSKRSHGHGNLLRLWRYVGDYRPVARDDAAGPSTNATRSDPVPSIASTQQTLFGSLAPLPG